MSAIPSRSELSAKDREIRLHTENRNKAIYKQQSVAKTILDLQSRIGAGSLNVTAAALAIASGKLDIDSAPDVSSLRHELAQQASIAEALHLGIEKIDEAIAARDHVLDEEYLASVRQAHRERFGRTFDALLTIAEIHGEEFALRQSISADAERLVPHMGSVSYPFWGWVKGGAIGTFPAARDYLTALAGHYMKQIGFQLSAEQLRRLEALAV